MCKPISYLYTGLLLKFIYLVTWWKLRQISMLPPEKLASFVTDVVTVGSTSATVGSTVTTTIKTAGPTTTDAKQASDSKKASFCGRCNLEKDGKGRGQNQHAKFNCSDGLPVWKGIPYPLNMMGFPMTEIVVPKSGKKGLSKWGCVNAFRKGFEVITQLQLEGTEIAEDILNLLRFEQLARLNPAEDCATATQRGIDAYDFSESRFKNRK
ncbi:hypothetical protein M422DRAFT_50202 [Sphaerobolus stellatus SS14]|uniref:Uncharacterized protein n=1 Tax=Sphaerobolus stellatus (strain SS14) TaxID=990650 RepID=A0A0C9V920_SPHS4|nr:hypothetical protein M422DRAFT_50202 [Sphaerobolus stellatus SS14]